MQEQWNDDQPIYRQLRDRMMGLIMDGAFLEGEPIPSVRTVSADYQINHLTVSKAYQMLVDDGLVEKRRGLGMFVKDGARAHILKTEKNQFLSVELPKLVQRLEQLGITQSELVGYIKMVNKEQNQ